LHNAEINLDKLDMFMYSAINNRMTPWMRGLWLCSKKPQNHVRFIDRQRGLKVVLQFMVCVGSLRDAATHS